MTIRREEGEKKIREDNWKGFTDLVYVEGKRAKHHGCLWGLGLWDKLDAGDFLCEGRELRIRYF